MARRVGLWTPSEFVILNLATLLQIGGLVVALRANPIAGGLMVTLGAGVTMALGFRLRGRVRRTRRSPGSET